MTLTENASAKSEHNQQQGESASTTDRDSLCHRRDACPTWTGNRVQTAKQLGTVVHAM